MRQTLFGNWGAALDDDAFACAVAAFGVLHDKAWRAGSTSLAARLRDGSLADGLKWAAGAGTLVRWRYPFRSDSFWIRTAPDAAELADAWLAFRDTLHPGLRLVLDASTAAAPPKGVSATGLPVLLDVLAHPAARVDASFIAWRVGRRVTWGWPLRIGLLDDKVSSSIGARVSELYPANALSRAFVFSRRESHCDVAVLSGSPRTSLAHILDSPSGERAGLVLFTGGLRGLTTSDFGMLEITATEMRSSGFAVVTSQMRDPGAFVNLLILHLSHNMPVDVALFMAARKADTGPPILFLDPAFVERAQLSAIADNMARNLERAGDTPVAITPGLSQRMGVPAGTTMSARAAGQALKSKISYFQFLGESQEATELVEAQLAVGAALRAVNAKRSDPRYIQAQVQRVGSKGTEHTQTLVVGEWHYVNVRIGPFDEEWLNPINHTPFPDELLPVDEDEHQLRVILSESHHIPEPLVTSVNMRSTGASEVAQFEFEPRPGRQSFCARITVTHRNRILQTAILSARVISMQEEVRAEDKISVEVEAVVRRQLYDLGGRSRFDMAFAFNHTPQGQPSMLSLADNHAVLRADASTIAGTIKGISFALSRVASEATRYVQGLASEEGLTLFRDLADMGRELYDYLIVKQADPVFGERLRGPSPQYIQIISLSPDAYFPAEFIYEFAVPAPDATICPAALNALRNGDYSKMCSAEDHAEGAKGSPHVCPFGFWGLRNVIERHAWHVVEDAPPGEYVLQAAEPTSARPAIELANATVFAASAQVDLEHAGAAQALFDSLRGILKTPVQRAATWQEWCELVNDPGQSKSALIALPHVEEENTGYGTKKYFLEIGGDMLKTQAITRPYVKAAPDAPPPLVMLLGCNTAMPQAAIESIVGKFQQGGAGIVVGTVASVLGSHATAVAQEMADQIARLTAGKEIPFGDLLLAMRRRALGHGVVMAMCVGGFGDADWLIKS